MTISRHVKIKYLNGTNSISYISGNFKHNKEVPLWEEGVFVFKYPWYYRLLFILPRLVEI